MPEVTGMSYTCDFNRLRGSLERFGASFVTRRHAGFALVVCAMVACATAGGAGRGESIDFRDDQGHLGNLDSMRGRVVVVDVCTSWAAACNVNAKVLDELQLDGVSVITILVDDESIAAQAARSYRDVLGVKHPVVTAGPRVRAGTSSLGEASYVPRLVVLDRDGAIALDDSGGVLNVEGLVAKLRPLVAKRAAGP